ncbi:BrnT family toxin [Salinarimonas chemoclinalis]|uniref:BrnT family toxin n=1 Tax=Salinarimonas chemoclinalis TaxID=3241599 RepID=UPI003556EC5F
MEERARAGQHGGSGGRAEDGLEDVRRRGGGGGRVGRRVEGEDDRQDYGERRLTAFGYVDGRCVSIVYTMRNEICRIISARPASRRERRSYAQARAKLEE